MNTLLSRLRTIMSTKQYAAPPSTISTVPAQVGDTGIAASTDVASPEAAFSTFKFFPRLPLELRLTIWRFAAFEPRNVEVCASNYWDGPGAPTYRDGPRRLLPHFFSTCPIPGLLHVNQEAREEGLKHFQAEFGNSVRLGGDLSRMDSPSFTFEPRIYVNWEVDRLCLMNSFDNHNLLEQFLIKAEENDVESMAICVGSAEHTYMARGVVHPDDGSIHLQWIHGLEELRRVMYCFPFHGSLKEVILFNHPFDHKLRLVSQRLKTTIDFNPFDYDRETTAEMYDKEYLLASLGVSVGYNRDWKFTACDDDDHLAKKIPGIDDSESEDDSETEDDTDANSQAEDHENDLRKMIVERTVSVKLREIFIKN